MLGPYEDGVLGLGWEGRAEVRQERPVCTQVAGVEPVRVPVQVTACVKVLRLEGSPHHHEARGAERGWSRQAGQVQ